MEAVWLPHPGFWVTKGSSVPKASKGPDKHYSHGLETGSDKLFLSHKVGSHGQNYVMLYNLLAFCRLCSLLVLKQVVTPCWLSQWEPHWGASATGDVCLTETCRETRSLPHAWLAHPWTKACQTSQRLRECFSIYANTMNLPGLERLQHKKKISFFSIKPRK